MHTVSRLSSVVSAVSVLVTLSACQTIPQPEWQLPPGVKAVTTNGYPMAYVERGSGPALVLVHGALNDYRYFTPQVESLSSRFRVISVSLRHYYPEPWNGVGNFGLDQHAADIATLIENLKLGPAYLVGWSRGGQVAVRTALTRPELIRKLVLMDAGISELVVTSAPGRGSTVPNARARTTEAFYKKGDIAGGLEYFFDDVNGAGAWKRLPELQRQIRLANAWTVVGQATDSNAKPVTCEDIGRQLAMPVLLMTGDKSPLRYKPIMDAFQRCKPATTRVTIPNAAHQMSQMNPTAVNAALAKFFLE